MMRVSGSVDSYKILSSSDLKQDEDQMIKNSSMDLPAQMDLPATLSISDEGMESWYNKLGNKSKTGWDEEEFQREKNNLGRNVFDVNYWNAIFQKALDYGRGAKSIEDRANGLVRAYAEVYDEIVQGYKSGTREIYKFDVDKNSYHKLTLEEELKNLNNAYNDEIDDYIGWEEAQHDDGDFLRDTLKEEAKVSKWSNWELLSRYDKQEIKQKKNVFLTAWKKVC